MTIAQEEIFGPVLAVIPYDTEDDAVRIANDSVYGLAGSVYTTDNEKALKIASKIRTGTYAVNMYAFDPGAPFGGYKNSGIGRENGPEGIEQYSRVQERAAAVRLHAGVVLDADQQVACGRRSLRSVRHPPIPLSVYRYDFSSVQYPRSVNRILENDGRDEQGRIVAAADTAIGTLPGWRTAAHRARTGATAALERSRTRHDRPGARQPAGGGDSARFIAVDLGLNEIPGMAVTGSAPRAVCGHRGPAPGRSPHGM